MNVKLKEYFKVGEVFKYPFRLFFEKPDPNKPKNFNLAAMHWINRIAIIMFLVCVVVIILRFISRA
ncbi:MAG: hypothetical protein NZ529_07535 [Cytophagaceae bacterium]|nr:hypothetical protein [Cytophagaceae bacterium]MDW8456636.1 DUF6728 family protein [Cytophagaceae bacterium]